MRIVLVLLTVLAFGGPVHAIAAGLPSAAPEDTPPFHPGASWPGVDLPSATPLSHDGGAAVGVAGFGDFDGDGRGDVLLSRVAWTSGEPGPVALTAREGLTGATVWTREIQGGTPRASELPGDVTGDGLDDLLVLSIVRDPTSVTGFRHTWVLRIVSGADGTDAWTLRLPYAFVHGVGRNVYVLPFVGHDVDGDGSRDVVVNAADVLLAGGTMLYSARSTIHSGSDGRVLLEREDGKPSTVLTRLEPAGRVIGRANGDYLLVEEDRGYCRPYGVGCPVVDGPRVRLSLLDGRFLTETWRASMPVARDRSFSVEPLGRDADGDGAPDVMVHEWWGSTAPQTTLFSGATGARRWSHDTSWFFDSAGSRDGQGFVHAPLIGVPDAVSFRVTLVDGATGADRTSNDVLVPYPDGDVASARNERFLFGDADGDADEDMVTSVRFVWFTDDGRQVREGVVRVVSTATGATLHESRFPGEQVHAHRVGDLDRDGAADLIVTSGWTSGAHVHALAPSAAATLWSHDLGEGASPSIKVHGGPAGDVVYGAYLPLDGSSTLVWRVVDGATGHVRWEHALPIHS